MPTIGTRRQTSYSLIPHAPDNNSRIKTQIHTVPQGVPPSKEAMLLPLVLALLAVWGGAWAPTATAQECPRVLLAGKAFPTAKRGILVGQKEAKITVILRSKSKGAAQDVNFKMELPAGLSVVKLKTHPSRMPSPAQIVPNPDGTTAIYWTDIDFKKSSKRLVRVEVIADDCAPETLDVSALAYLVNATDPSVYCVAPLAKPVVLRVRYPGDKKTGSGKHASSRPVTCAPTPAPSVNPATPFVPYGLGQRCLQAGRLAPFGVDRRMSAESQVVGEADSRDKIHEERRRLGPEVISTPSDCWDYCSLNGGEPVQFFFNWNTVTNQCFCCGDECTLILDSDFDAFAVVVAATQAPTTAPATMPTQLPTQEPTTVPTTIPTQLPTEAPTTVPTTMPTQLPTEAPSTSLTTAPTGHPTSLPTSAPSITCTTNDECAALSGGVWPTAPQACYLYDNDFVDVGPPTYCKVRRASH